MSFQLKLARAMSKAGACTLLLLAVVIGSQQPASAEASGNAVPFIRGGWEDWSKPQIVALYDAQYVGFCTGVVISSKVVLTAAHCPLHRAKHVRFDLEQPTPGVNTARWREVTSFARAVPHAQPPYYGADLATVTFSGGLPEDVKPARLVNAQDLKASSNLRITGYGINEKNSLFGGKATANVKLMDSGCVGGDGAQAKKKATQFQCGAGLEFLAGDRVTEADACDGDSGGPILVEMKGDKNSNWGVVGIVSRGGALDPEFICGRQGSIYTLLEPYEEWLVGQGVDPLRSHPKWISEKYTPLATQ